jgi:hypothetical protein
MEYLLLVAGDYGCPNLRVNQCDTTRVVMIALRGRVA